MLKSLSSSSSSSSKSLINNNNNNGIKSTIRSGYRYHRIPANMAMDTGNNHNNNNDDDDDDDDVDQNNSNDHNDDDLRTTTTTTTTTATATKTTTTTTTIDDRDPRSRVCIQMMVANNNNHNNNHNDNDDHDNRHHHHHHHRCCIQNFQNYLKTILNMIRIPSPVLLLKFVKNIRCLLIFIFFILLFVIQFKSGPFNNYHYNPNPNHNNHHADHHHQQPQPQYQLEEQQQQRQQQIGHHNNDTTNHGQASRTIIIMNQTNNQVINDDGSIIPRKISKTSSSSSSASSSSSSIVATVGGSISNKNNNSNKDDHNHHHNDNDHGDDHEIKSTTTNITNNEPRMVVNTTTNTTTIATTTTNQTEQLKNCPLVPPNLVGRLKVLTEPPEMDQLELMFPDVELGGRFRPKHCHSHHRVAIIVPYRDRDYHLRVFLLNLHPMLMRQNIDYAIYIVEQYDKSTRFNRAKLMNVGFLEAGKQYPYDCYIFHDVDLIPEDDRNLYTCPQQPRHMSVAIDKFHYRLPYKDIFGGVSALTKAQFIKANGFSNEFWGWGGEDDDMSNRIRHYGFNISRYPINIARYKMLKHENGVPNSERFKKLYNGWRRFKTDGINTIKYRIVDIVFKKLYTWIHVDLLEPKRPYSSRHQKHHYG